MTADGQNERNRWDYETPDPRLVRGDIPTGAMEDRSTAPPADTPTSPPAGDGERAPRGLRRGRAGLLILLVLVAAIATVVVALAGDDSGDERIVTAPDVRTLDEAGAVRAIESAGLRLGQVTTRTAGPAEVGTVVDQSPAAGAGVDEGSIVDLVIGVESSEGEEALAEDTGDGGEVEEVAVPNVLALSEAEARQVLADEGLRIGDVERITSEEAPGTVLVQNPSAGSIVDAGEEVDLRVSSGEATASVPTTAGLELAEAVQVLERDGWSVSFVDAAHEAVPEGRIISSEPAAGEEVPVTTVVELTVSTGPPVVEVPNVVGLSVFEAGAVLRDLGFEPSTSACDVTDPSQAGDVVGQIPAPGSEERVGSVVGICIGVVPPTPTPVPTTPPSTGGSSGGGSSGGGGTGGAGGGTGGGGGTDRGPCNANDPGC